MGAVQVYVRKHFQCKPLMLLAISYAISIFFVHAQVYGYDPVRFSNSETNPAFLSGGENKKTFTLLQHNSLSEKLPFSFSSARYSVYLKNVFTGLSAGVSSASYGKTAQMSTLSFGAAYRTLFLNTVFLTGGFMYKGNFLNAPSGRFNYGSFSADTIGQTSSSLVHNINLSVSMAAHGSKAFINGGVLNLAAKTSDVFPVYFFMNIGDIGKLISDDRWSCYYTLLVTRQSGSVEYFNYLNFQQKLNITRNNSLIFGFRSGLSSQRKIQLNALINYNVRKRITDKTGNRSYAFYTFQLLFDFTFLKYSEQSYPPGAQVSFSYHLK